MAPSHALTPTIMAPCVLRLAPQIMNCMGPRRGFVLPTTLGVVSQRRVRVCGSIHCAPVVVSVSQPPCAPATMCPPFTVSHGTVSCSRAGTPVGSSCTTTCGAGYLLHGNSTVTCTAAGTWSGAIPACVASTSHCSALAPLPSSEGVMVCSAGDSQGSVCAVTCRVGHRLVGSESRTCRDGEWTGTSATCVGTLASCSVSVSGTSACSCDCACGSEQRRFRCHKLRTTGSTCVRAPPRKASAVEAATTATKTPTATPTWFGRLAASSGQGATLAVSLLSWSAPEQQESARLSCRHLCSASLRPRLLLCVFCRTRLANRCVDNVRDFCRRRPSG